jgi:hypothetical protein
VIEVQEEYWTVTYRTVTREPTDMSHLGSNWDDVQLGEWQEVGINFTAERGGRREASKCYWGFVDQGYDCRFKHVAVKKEVHSAFPMRRSLV